MVKPKSRNANDIKDIDHKLLSGDILRCVLFYKLYCSDPHHPGVSGTFILILLFLDKNLFTAI